MVSKPLETSWKAVRMLMATDDRQLPCGRNSNQPPPRSRRAERTDRHGRRPQLLGLRLDHDAERKLLPLHELRQHERVLLRGVTTETHWAQRNLRPFVVHSGWRGCV